MKVVKVYRKVKKPKLVKKTSKKSKIKALNALKNSSIKVEYAKYIDEFIQTLVNKGSNYDFTLLANNLRKLKIIVVPKLDGNNMATYDAYENALYIAEEYLDKLDEIIYHEIFHISSSFKKDEECFIGFQKNILFNCFNEGYTEVLKKRYFGDKSKETPYLFEMIIAEIVEFIIGKKKMENLYSKADCLGMLVEFSKYVEKTETTYVTLGNVDRMSDYYDKANYKECMLWVRNIIIVLINAFTNKCRKGISTNDIDSFFKLLPLFYTYNDVDYDIFMQQEINEYKEKCYAISKSVRKIKIKLKKKL